MSSIRIVATPPGKAPEEVREAWVGLVLPLPHQLTKEESSELFGDTEMSGNGYQVSTSEAFLLLYQKSPDAALWFLRHTRLTGRLVFPREVCQLLP